MNSSKPIKKGQIEDYISPSAQTALNLKVDKVAGERLINASEILDISTALQPSDIVGLVPYTGATTNVDLGEHQVKAGQFEFDQTPTGTFGVGKVRWNDTDGTIEVMLKGGNVTLQVGQEQLLRVVNKTGTNLLESEYHCVYISGAQGNRLKVDLALSNNTVNSNKTIGLVTENIDNNLEGFVTTDGLVRNINTTGSQQSETWVDGDVLYLSAISSGHLTNIPPISPNHKVVVGYVVRAHTTQGSIFVKVNIGLAINELHDVNITASTANKLIGSTTEGLWENKTVADILGYTPVGGNGTENYIPKFNTTNNLVDSLAFFDTNGLNVKEPNSALYSAFTTLNNDSSSLLQIGIYNTSHANANKSFMYAAGSTTEIGYYFGLTGKKMNLLSSGRLLLNTDIDNGVDNLQVAGSGALNSISLTPIEPYNGTYLSLISGYGTTTIKSNGAGTYAGTVIGYDVHNNIKFQSNGSTIFGNLFDDGSGALIQIAGDTNTHGLSLTTSPTTSASTYDILTRNTSTGKVEKINSLPTSALIQINEGNGIGNVLNNRNALNYGNVGLMAFDISNYDNTSSIYGATGTLAFAGGDTVKSSGFASFSFGLKIINEANGGTSFGWNSSNRGWINSIFGIGHDIKSMSATVVGQASEIVDVQILDWNASPSSKPMFIVGNGTIANADSNYTVLSRSNAFKVMMDGSVLAPSLTISLINLESTGKVVTTKEYVDSKRVQRLAQYTVSTLPTGVQGDNAYVTDALAPTYMTTVVGGGSVVTPVFHNGTNWIAH